jgi:solute carrier family 35 protein
MSKRVDDDVPSSHLHIPTHLHKVAAALFYGISSILVIFTNKAVMTNYKFKYFDVLATVQFLVTSVILLLLVAMKRVEIPMLTYPIFRETLPVTIMFLGNVLCGLGSTKSLSIPMFTALRRFSILLTMLGEWFLLKNKPSNDIIISVGLMVGGTLIASLYDLSFDLEGYILVFLNNIFTALNGVYMKKAAVSGKCSKMAVLFYNSLFSAIIMVTYFLVEHINISASELSKGDSSVPHPFVADPAEVNPALRGTISNTAVTAIASTLTNVFTFPAWSDSTFVITFILAVSMGSVLNYSIFLCTTINSPLTTAVVGATKNIATTYIGMIVFNDYAFTWLNFAGINISIIGSLYYTYMILFKGAVGFGAV